MGNCLQPLIGPRYNDISTREIKVPIIFLIGGPGAGKRTQCARIEERYDFVIISTSDLLRYEVAKGTQKSIILARLMSVGQLIPSSVLIELIKDKMQSTLHVSRGFLVSGFPRENEQSKLFEQHVCPPDLVLYLCVRNAVLMDRVLARTVTTTERQEHSFDDLKERIEDFSRKNKLILKRYKKRVVVIDGEQEEADVFRDICIAIDDFLSKFPSSSTENS